MAYGLEVAVMGVAVVFAFLTALVLSIELLGRFFRIYERRFPESAPRSSGRTSPRGPAASGPQSLHIAAIVAAIEAHRSRGGR
jgi:sodium pump decarboxylase gamma subunit